MELKELFGEQLFSQIEPILKEKGVSLLVDNPKEPSFVPKKRLDEVIGQRNDLKTQIGELSGQIDSLKKLDKSNEKLQEKLQELQQKNAEWEGKYNNSVLDNAIKYQALQEKAKDPSDLLHYLDKSKLQIDEQGNVKGLDEQLKTIKEKKSYLFDSSEPQKPPSTPALQGVNPSNLGSFKGELALLQDQMKEAISKRDFQSQIALQSQIFELTKPQ